MAQMRRNVGSKGGAPVLAEVPVAVLSAEEPKKFVRKAPTGRWIDVSIAGSLYLIALFARLYNISDPAGIVFDEVHFNKASVNNTGEM